MPDTHQTEHPAEVTREIERLESRLKALRAIPSTSDEPQPQDGPIDMLMCFCGDVCFGLETDIISRVVMIPALEGIPNAPTWLAGMCTIQDQTVPVVDMTSRLLNQPADIREDRQLIICETQERQLGLLVDQTDGVQSISPDWFPALDPAMPFTDFVTAVASHEGKTVYLVSADRIVRGLDSELYDGE